MDVRARIMALIDAGAGQVRRLRLAGQPIWDLPVWSSSAWRTFGPASASVAAHVAILASLGALIAATNPRPQPPAPPPPPTMAVTLVTNIAPPPPRAQTPRNTAATPRAAAPASEALPETAPAIRDRRRSAMTDPRASASSGASADEEAEILPPARTGVPLGLRGLLEKSPCSQVIVRLRGDCDSRWAALAEQGGLDHSPTLDELAEMYPGFQLEEPDNPFWMPKAPERLTRKASLSGGRVMGPMGAMPSGVAGAGGPSDSVGRLPPKNAMHADPAFELRPQWLDHD